MRPFSLASVALVALLVAACGAGTPAPTESPVPTGGPEGYPGWPPLDDGGELLPLPVTSELVVGQNRFLLNLLDDANQSVASPDRQVALNFYDLAADAATPAITVSGTYLTTIAQLPGLYRAEVQFTRSGTWGLEAEATEPDGSVRTGRMLFSVRQTGSTPPIGGQAVRSVTPTAQTADELELISTDDHPEPDYYRLSVDQALSEHRPFLLVFATPAFCRTATCGPALDIVKGVTPDFAGRVDVIHVEPYELELVDGHLQPVLEGGQLVPVEATIEWGLLTEPMLFAVDGDGTIIAKLEGVASADEIRAALEEVAP
ncbi:hypothetical protein BH23CHL7_BH23CHL7_09450 [soil metagenome]